MDLALLDAWLKYISDSPCNFIIEMSLLSSNNNLIAANIISQLFFKMRT